jgi:hypothetical protein
MADKVRIMHEPEKTPSSRTDEFRRNISKSFKHLRKSLTSGREYAEGEPRPIEMALLAALLRPDAAKNPRSAYEKAWAFLDAELEHIPFEDLSLGDMKAKLRKDLRIENALVTEWKLNIGPRMSFPDALQTEWCEHPSQHRLTVAAKRVGYPEPFLKDGGQLTEASYGQILERDAQRRRKLDSERKRESRAKPLQQRKKQDSE